MHKNWLFIVVLGTFLVLLFLSSCENDLEEVREVISKEEIAKEEARDVQILYSDSAQVKVSIRGPLLVRYLDKKAPREEFPSGIKVDFFGPNNTVQSKLTAKYAIRYEQKHQVVVRDSVVWESANDETLETEELIWDDIKQKVFSDKFVKITKPGEKIFGYGFEANQDFTHWKINAVEGEIKVDGFEDELK